MIGRFHRFLDSHAEVLARGSQLTDLPIRAFHVHADVIDLRLHVLRLRHRFFDDFGDAWAFLGSEFIDELAAEAVTINVVLVHDWDLVVSILVSSIEQLAIRDWDELVEAHLAE